eukprot:CAMPEP_0185735240 /NCGR_PEP_ID=MMETSP1171-20130828/24684_1 /TAXON_ID=374046 /ORGANISM="Helicotheca tamensis, Strain CCMP826" /LENGTH=193 /DNA_ID=CAMNT_0028405461 /DNA_START=78 /DNA_END=659 /DNA_ORIENTATION=-
MLAHREITKLLDLDETWDVNGSEYDDNSEASECGSECNFEEDVYFDYGSTSSSQNFQHLVHERKVHAIIDGINLLSYDFESDEDKLDMDSQYTPTTEEELDDCMDMHSLDLKLNDGDSSKVIRSSALDCNGVTSETIHRIGSIEDFERRAIEKKISMGKIIAHNADDPSNYTHFQFIKRHMIMAPLHLSQTML